MRKFLFLFSLSFFLFGCSEEDAPNNEEILTSNATILIDRSEVDNCLYSVRTEDNESFSTAELPGDHEGNEVKAKITYKLTEEYIDCGFGGMVPEIVILELKVIE